MHEIILALITNSSTAFAFVCFVVVGGITAWIITRRMAAQIERDRARKFQMEVDKFQMEVEKMRTTKMIEAKPNKNSDK